MTNTMGETLETLRQLLGTTERIRADALERGDEDFAAREAEDIAKLHERIAALEATAARLAERRPSPAADDPASP